MDEKLSVIAEIIKEQTITDWDGNVLNSEEVADLIVKYVLSGAMPVPVRRMRWSDTLDKTGKMCDRIDKSID